MADIDISSNPVPIPMGAYCDEKVFRNTQKVLLVCLSLPAERLHDLLENVALAQLTTGGFRPMFLTDVAAPQMFKRFGYRFEYVPARDGWPMFQSGRSYAQFLRTRVASLIAAYDPDVVLTASADTTWGDLLALGCGGPPSPASQAARTLKTRATKLQQDNTKLKTRVAELSQELEQANKRVAYERMREQFRHFVQDVTPETSNVLVMTKGDPELLSIPGRRTGHFPQGAGGEYSGAHPANSSEAIGHLQALIASGGDFVAIPETSLWWLEHYEEFTAHLTSVGRLLAFRAGVGVVYALTDGAEPTVRLSVAKKSSGARRSAVEREVIRLRQAVDDLTRSNRLDQDANYIIRLLQRLLTRESRNGASGQSTLRLVLSMEPQMQEALQRYSTVADDLQEYEFQQVGSDTEITQPDKGWSDYDFVVLHAAGNSGAELHRLIAELDSQGSGRLDTDTVTIFAMTAEGLSVLEAIQ